MTLKPRSLAMVAGHPAVGYLVAVLALALVLGGCSAPSQVRDEPQSRPGAVTEQPSDAELNGSLVDPPLPRPTQVLRDDRGATFSLADRPGDELTVLFFGYTHCPDVCPTTMADLAQARAQLPPAAQEHVTVALVTEDPDRDTPTALRRWLHRFDPTFIGLVGGNAASTAMLEELYSPATRRLAKPETPIKHPASGHGHHDHGNYGIEHSSIVYVFAPGGTSVIYTGGTTASQYAADFLRLLEPTT